MRRIYTLILFIITIQPLTASGLKDVQHTPEVRVLYVPGVADPFYYSLEKGARLKAEELGVQLSVSTYPSFWDPEEQTFILMDAVKDRSYDLVMIAPTAKDALIAPLRELHDRGIRIITVDTKIGNGDYSGSEEWTFPLTHIGTDNYAGGIRLAEFMAEQVREKGRVYINTTTPETSTTEERKDGFVEGIARFPDMEVVRIDYNGDLQSVAREQTLKALQDYPDLVGVFGSNVFSSQGVSEAISNTGLSGAVRVAAWDATESLIEGLRNGEVDVILAQKPGEIGALAIEWASRYFREGKEIPRSITSGSVLFTPSNLNDPDMKEFFYTK
jgi:ribose transport system substrate-binding protein